MTPPPPELIRRTARRLLRLTAVLLEDVPDPAQLERALLALGQLGEPLTARSGDSDPIRRLCGDLAALADAARAAVSAPAQGHGQAGAGTSSAALPRLRAECVRLLPGVAKVLGSGSVDGTPAVTRS
jgi:hypothetical protein